MKKSADQVSLPEKDYLSILDIITGFYQCRTRGDLIQAFRNHLFTLFEAQVAAIGYSDTDLSTFSPDYIGFTESCELSDYQKKIAALSTPYSALHPLMGRCNRGVLTMDIDSPRATNLSNRNRFFKDHPEINPEDVLFIAKLQTCLMSFELPIPILVFILMRIHPCTKFMTLRDVRIMELLRPHLLQSIKTVLLNEELAKYQSLTETLADSPTPMALVRMDMILIFQNRVCKDCLQLEEGQRLPKDLIELLEKESARYKPTDISETSAVEFPFYKTNEGVFRLGLTQLDRNGTEEEKRWLLRLHPVVEPYTKMKLMMQDKGLTGREMEITTLVQDGMDNQEIADRLFISPQTVKTHLKPIFEKMGVNSRAKLMAALSGE